jgi:CMP-N,N'-diacetyllegionaminic acid synthase
MPNVLAVVPARGGSKGIPGKNLAMCAGRPLIDWTAQAIKDSELIDFSVLSTDNSQIVDAWTGGSFVVTHDPIPDDAQIEDRLDRVFEAVHPTFSPDYAVLLQPTSPIRTGKMIDEAIRMMEERRSDSLLSVVQSHRLFWQTRDGGDHMASYKFSDRPPRQAMSNRFEENGSIYVFTMDHWRATHLRIGGRVTLMVMPEQCGYQVDTPLDLILVEKILLEQEARLVAV